jgi:hypothetical protein
LIDPNLWTRAWRAAVDALPVGVSVVVDDCRFPNEAVAVTEAGGVLIQINRPGAGAGAAGHSSEAHQLPTACTLENVGSERQLREMVDTLLRDLSWVEN